MSEGLDHEESRVVGDNEGLLPLPEKSRINCSNFFRLDNTHDMVHRNTALRNLATYGAGAGATLAHLSTEVELDGVWQNGGPIVEVGHGFQVGLGLLGLASYYWKALKEEQTKVGLITKGVGGLGVFLYLAGDAGVKALPTLVGSVAEHTKIAAMVMIDVSFLLHMVKAGIEASKRKLVTARKGEANTSIDRTEHVLDIIQYTLLAIAGTAHMAKELQLEKFTEFVTSNLQVVSFIEAASATLGLGMLALRNDFSKEKSPSWVDFASNITLAVSLTTVLIADSVIQSVGDHPIAQGFKLGGMALFGLTAIAECVKWAVEAGKNDEVLERGEGCCGRGGYTEL